MSAKAIAALTGVLLVILTCCVGAAVIGAGGVALAVCTNPAPSITGATPDSPPPPAGGRPSVGQWNGKQVANAATIVAVGQQLHVPPRGWVIAVATAMQESALTNLGDLGPHNDHDSLGLFQQRPSSGFH